MKFICPKCSLPLSVGEDGAAKCPRLHSFDRSREGYYNLLLSTGGRQHGDNKEMLAARRDFLDTGAYFPLAETIKSLLLEKLPRGAALLDMGCGEGYYTDVFERALRERDGDSAVSAFDISKDAVRLAAKRNGRISIAVAGSYRIPAADESFDGVVNIFSPLALEETARILKKGGVYIMAIPDRRHLFELKELLYDKLYENSPAPTELSGFCLLAEKRVAYSLDLNSGEKIMRLFKMTPYAYRTPPAALRRIEQLSSLECRAEFIVLAYQKI